MILKTIINQSYHQENDIKNKERNDNVVSIIWINMKSNNYNDNTKMTTCTI